MGLFGFRFVSPGGAGGGLAALFFDGGFFLVWAKNLASGYYDHPPSIAFLIRGGTALFGDTSMGLRFLPWLLSATASWAVWRAGATFPKKHYARALPPLIFHLIPMIGVGFPFSPPPTP